MSDVWQANKTNPAFFPEDRQIIVSLPGIQNTLYFSGATYGDAFREENGEDVFDVDNLIANLEDRNVVRENLELETVGFAIALGKLRLSLAHSTRFQAYFNFPKTLPQLIWKGNAQFIGETIDLNNDLQLYSYNQFALGGAWVGETFSIGARFKLLAGIGDVSSVRGEASLYTDPEVYQLEFSADYLLNTSSVLDYQNYNDLELDYSLGQIEELMSSNIGWAADLGAQLKLEDWRFSASLIDIGQIRWTENAKSYSSEGTYSYDGLDVSNALTGDSVSFEQALDTLEAIFAFEETPGAYTTTLPARLYVSAQYDLSETITLGGLFYSEWYRGEMIPAVALSGQFALGEALSLGAVYSVVRDSYFNLGANLRLDLGPVQIYGVTDNIAAAFRPAESRYFQFRTGLNLIF